MNSRQRRVIRRGVRRSLPQVWRVLHEAADFVERNEPAAAISHLRLCAAEVNKRYASLAGTSIAERSR